MRIILILLFIASFQIGCHQIPTQEVINPVWQISEDSLKQVISQATNVQSNVTFKAIAVNSMSNNSSHLSIFINEKPKLTNEEIEKISRNLVDTLMNYLVDINQFSSYTFYYKDTTIIPKDSFLKFLFINDTKN